MELLWKVHRIQSQSTQTIQRGAGETVTVHCDYGEDYKNYGKIWCRETGRNICNTILITSLQRGVPRVNATSGRTLISDNKETQQISVTVQKLEKPDTGVYWCGVYFNYTKEVQIMKRIVLRISEDFTNFRVRMPTASTDESQDEDIKDNSEGARCSVKPGLRSRTVKMSALSPSALHETVSLRFLHQAIPNTRIKMQSKVNRQTTGI
ncbi:trem-like transcript 4 protein isoform X3 [Pleurodeles waltl]|uniref:trem-like transcript 4 protein isoform X3 n=1 Tax=Pleurodeles waltl TaxID=8319 RepID=UPI0037094261